jgi:hypothetical protein
MFGAQYVTTSTASVADHSVPESTGGAVAG